MKKIKHICFVVPNYPTKNDPVYTFVKELICSIADLGIKCTVIAPQSLTNFINKSYRKRPFFWEDTSEMGNVISVYQPIHAPFLKLNILGVNISTIFSEWAVNRAFKKIESSPDILYAHFWHNGVIAGEIGQKYNIPVFVASGESKIWVRDLYQDDKIYNSLNNIHGVIAVSTKNKEESINLNLSSKSSIKIIPNSINPNLFYPIEKSEARRKLGFNQDDFIVSYLGSFNHRKGVLRLSEAIKKCSEVKSIFIGSGKLKPDCGGILYSGKLPHDQIVNYLNASDIFVLPTLAEGCCNAIIEAMACGLPIVSSNLSFNDDILTEKNSIRIDSNDVDQIAEAINYLKHNPKVVKSMSNASIQLAQDLDLDNRAKKIINFVTEKCNVL